MARRRRTATVAALAVATLVAVGAPASGQAPEPGPFDCEGPAGDPEPGTAEWEQRDRQNQYCAEQRHLDKLAHPFDLSPPDEPGADVYREPARHDGVRFRHDTTVVEGLEVEVHRPCAEGTCTDVPEELRTFEPPYPAVVTFHGGLSRKELHWWSSQTLAEAGYLVVAYDSEGRGPTEEEAGVLMDWLHGDDPLVADFDGERVGIAGHSGGGVVVNGHGHTDPRVDAIVAWDRAQSTPLADDVPLRAPSLFVLADYNCQQVPVCQPEPHDEPPDPDGPGNKGQDFQLVRDAGVDTMQLALRAALHLDWVPSDLAGNRHAELVTVYFTRAWFDRYVRGQAEPQVAADAFDRLTGATFDDSADRLNISQGLYDPARAAAAGDPYAGNVPYTIAGTAVADRLSFYHLSRCFLTVPGTSVRVSSDDVRADGCTAADPESHPPPPPERAPAPAPAPEGEGAPRGDLPATGGGIATVSLGVLALAAGLRGCRRGR